MNAVGIDVSKGKSVAAAVNFSKEVTLAPREFEHTEIGFERLIYDYLLPLNSVVMETIGRYRFFMPRLRLISYPLKH